MDRGRGMLVCRPFDCGQGGIWGTGLKVDARE
jgi:hypothetical protein